MVNFCNTTFCILLHVKQLIQSWNLSYDFHFWYFLKFSLKIQEKIALAFEIFSKTRPIFNEDLIIYHDSHDVLSNKIIRNSKTCRSHFNSNYWMKYNIFLNKINEGCKFVPTFREALTSCFIIGNRSFCDSWKEKYPNFIQ